jgi:hypothetical protein
LYAYCSSSKHYQRLLCFCIAGETVDSETANGETVTSVTSVTASGAVGATAAFTASNKLLCDGANICCIVHTADIVTEIVHTPITNNTSSSKHSKYKARSSSSGNSSSSSSSTGHSSNVTTRQYIVTTLDSCHMFNNVTGTQRTAGTAATTAAAAQPMDVDTTTNEVSNTALTLTPHRYQETSSACIFGKI